MTGASPTEPSLGSPDSPPSDPAGSDTPPGDAPATYTVAELCDHVGTVIEKAFEKEAWVKGAISGLTRSAKGHVYFDLIEPSDDMGRQSSAVLPVALFASQRHLVNRVLRRVGGMRMHDGVEIRIRGKVAYYPPQGRIQMVMSLIDPQYTLGQMAAARQRLLETFSAEGLLDRNAEIDLSPAPLNIALITSDQSAAYFDFVNEITTSPYPFVITLLDARVQGVDAAADLKAAVDTVNEVADAKQLDVVVIVRGGGARTDLVAFDDEALARSIATCALPVVVGVGHETDRSVADEVAHTVTKTPTAAARFLVDAVQLFDVTTLNMAERMAGLARWHLNTANDRLKLGGSRLANSAHRVTDRQELHIDHLADRLTRLPNQITNRAAERLEVVEARLDALDPAHALRRGWTITTTADGQLIRTSSQVTSGDELHTLTAAGTIISTVRPAPE